MTMVKNIIFFGCLPLVLFVITDKNLCVSLSTTSNSSSVTSSISDFTHPGFGQSTSLSPKDMLNWNTTGVSAHPGMIRVSTKDSSTLCLLGQRCVHGLCVSGLRCQCDAGWTGFFCSAPEASSESLSLSQPPPLGTNAGIEERVRSEGEEENGGQKEEGAGGVSEKGQECIPGFQCMHGLCTLRPLGCVCEKGWEGIFCHIPDMQVVGTSNDNSSQPPTITSSPDSNHTLPARQGKFTPLEGYGPLVDFSLRDCAPAFECRYGNCSNPHIDGIKCLCEPGFYGLFCEMPCLVDCGPHAKCVESGRCECDKEYTGTNCSMLRTFDEDEVIMVSYWPAVGVSVSVMVVMVVLLVMVPYWLWRRGNITMMKMVFWFQTTEDDDGRVYDAFVSYASTSDDRQFVMDQLIPMLEDEMAFTLCIHERDFMPGKYITSNIMDSVRQSRRTLLVISPAFVSRNWCQFEFQAAVAEMIEKKHRILPVILGDMKLIKQASTSGDTFERVMNSVTYLQYPGDDASQQETQRFWKRLKLSMPKKTKRPTSSTPSSSISPPTTSNHSFSSKSRNERNSTNRHYSVHKAHDVHHVNLEPISLSNQSDKEASQTSTSLPDSGKDNSLSVLRKALNRFKNPRKGTHRSRYSINYQTDNCDSLSTVKTIEDKTNGVNRGQSVRGKEDNSDKEKVFAVGDTAGKHQQLFLADWTWPSPANIQQTS